MHRLIINFCPTGMVPMKDHTPHVPIDPSEIIEQTHEAWELGITIAHLHAREPDGRPTSSKDVYREIFEGVRKHCPDLVICGSTSGRNVPEFERRSAVIELEPDMCSLTLSSLNFMEQISQNSPDMIRMLAEKMAKYGVKPELECFDLGMVNFGKYLIAKKIIEGPYYWNLLFGNIAGFQPTFSHIASALSEIQGEQHFVAFGGLGRMQSQTLALAIAGGFGVRVGIEDNLWMDNRKTKLATNIMLLKRVHELMRLHERELFTPSEFGKAGFYNAHTVARV